ncbi:hypothetical protein KR009_006186 [Drosophila setifemur]|nr:hypothetical protein KR009_006186 [Drosophila setifemur]
MRADAAVSCFLLLFNSVCCQSEEGWVDPHQSWSDLAMGFDDPQGSCQCPALPERSPAEIEDGLAMIYFKKFANLLFQRKRLQYNAKSALYKRSMLFSLLESQLEELEHVRDPRDLDVLLTKILENAEPAPLFKGESGCSYAQQGGLALVLDIFYGVSATVQNSEIQFLLFVVFAILLGYVVHKRFGFRVITIIAGSFFLCGYLFTYLECNRKLEVESMLEVINSHQEQESYAEMSWFARIKSYAYGKLPQLTQKEVLRKSSKINLTYCLPDRVFLMYINDLFLHQLEQLMEKVAHTMSRLTSNLGFPYNLIAPLFLVILVGYIIKLTFKYLLSPKAWAPIIHARSAPAVDPQHLAPQQSISANEFAGDVLSGENLKMLLNVMTATSVQQQKLPAGSGVQEVMEALEAPSSSSASTPEKKEKLDTSNASDSSKSKNSLQEEGFTLVDDPEDIGIDTT